MDTNAIGLIARPALGGGRGWTLLAAALALSGCAAPAGSAPAAAGPPPHGAEPGAVQTTARTRAVAATTAPPESGRTSPALPPPAPDSELAELLKQGATMEEIAKVRDPVATSPVDALHALKTGNARFYGGQARRPELSANERRSQILSQTPFAVVLGCSDSRVPVEIVYDQSLGSIFTIRVAGSVVEPATAGSIEYAVEHLKSYIVVVMGHEGCGAVAGAMGSDEELRREPENVRFLLNLIRPAVEGLPSLRDRKALMREAVIANIRLQVHRLNQNPVVIAAIKKGKIQVVGAYYEIGSGAVDFLEEDAELKLTDEEKERAANDVRQAALAEARAATTGAVRARLRRAGPRPAGPPAVAPAAQKTR